MNYIMICLDSLRQDHIGAYGGCALTPHMDKLAAESAVFSRLRSEALPTVPVRRALCTGVRVFPWEYRPRPKGIYNRHSGWLPLREKDVTLAEHLAERGYVTGMVIDVYHLMKPAMNFHRGMSSFEFIRGQELDRFSSGPLPDGALDRYVPEDAREQRVAVLQQYMQNQYRAMASADIAGRREEDHQCARVFQTAMNWLEMNAAHDGFYLWVDSFDPHEPWDVPDKYIEMYDPGYEGKEWIYPNILAGTDMTTEEITHAKALYAAEVTMVDHWLGKFLDKIDEVGLRDNTLVVLLSDHGKIVGEFDNFGMSNKDTSRYLYDVPLMVRHPQGIGAGTRLDQWVYDIDITATALEVLGEDPLEDVDGRSFWPLITGEVEKLHDHTVCAYSEVSCVWQDDYVYIQDNELETSRLYDAWADKAQEHDLSGELPELMGEMKAKLDELVAAGPH